MKKDTATKKQQIITTCTWTTASNTKTVRDNVKHENYKQLFTNYTFTQ